MHVLKRCSGSHLRVKSGYRVLNLEGFFKNLSPQTVWERGSVLSRGKVQVNKEHLGSGLNTGGTF